ELAEGLDLSAIEIDVTNNDSVLECARHIEVNGDTVDVLVNNAGVAFNSVTEDIDVDRAKEVMDVNVWGPVRCVKAFVPGMRERGSGHIFQVSSVAGLIGHIGQTVYVGSKFALEGMSEALAQELISFGIRVHIVEPGVTRTAILPKNEGNPVPTAYQDHYDRMFQFYTAGIAASVQAESFAETIYEALTSSDYRLRYVCGWGGEEIGERHKTMSDEEFVEMGSLVSSAEEYGHAFFDLFGLRI
ncbi:MAG: SDR family NAD(P)-dependent oxidoreductase, partial [Actinomycetota bacterium]|nr:SDR family NAD(P)-dependent oxidoreductase [Actinomycetota bacterium]